MSEEDDPLEALGEGEDEDDDEDFKSIAWQSPIQSPRCFPKPEYYKSYDELVESEHKIETTSRKKKIVDGLHDYWKLKGLLLRIRRSPALILESKNLEVITKFLEKYTEMPRHRFWSQLDKRHKLGIAKRLTIVEGHAQKQYMSSAPGKPELYIVLSGKVLAQSFSDNQKIREDAVFGHGSVFGSIDEFNDYADHLTFGTKASVEHGAALERTTVTVTMCTLLRLSFRDYTLEVSPPKSPLEDLEEDEYLIATSTTMRIEDIICLRFCKQSKKALSATLYEFLVEFGILPRDSSSPSYQYMRIGNIGREITLTRDSSKLIYIIIDGSMRLRLVKPHHHQNAQNGSSLSGLPGGDSSSSYEISCHRKGQPAVRVKTQSLPVLIVEVGSVFVINESCFSVKSQTSLSSSLPLPAPGQDGNPKAAMLSSTLPETASTNLNNSLPRNSVTSTLRQSNSRMNRRNKNAAPLELYQIQIVFDCPTTYLAIPQELFKSAMRQTTIEINKEITEQLNQISTSLSDRISSMLPWINGTKDLLIEDHPSAQGNIILPPIRADKNPKSRLGPVTLAELGLDHTLGSFFQAGNRQDTSAALAPRK